MGFSLDQEQFSKISEKSSAIETMACRSFPENSEKNSKLDLCEAQSLYNSIQLFIKKKIET
jgi:hypothetical protein